jgi:predicted CoA-binding protein
MPSKHEQFWTLSSYAFVGHSAKKPFPKLSFREAKNLGKTVFAVDPSLDRIDDAPTYPDLESLPEKVEAVVLEPPQEETEDWVRRAADAGIKNVWIHMGRETPGAVAVAEEKGLNLLTGTCAVMYVKKGPSFHSIHKWINRLIGKY